MDHKTLYIIRYSHKHGNDVWPEFRADAPDEEDVVTELRLGGAWEDGDEARIDTYVEVYGPFDIPKEDQGRPTMSERKQFTVCLPGKAPRNFNIVEGETFLQFVNRVGSDEFPIHVIPGRHFFANGTKLPDPWIHFKIKPGVRIETPNLLIEDLERWCLDL